MSSFKISTHRRNDRHDAAGSRDRDRRHARQGPARSIPMTVTLERSGSARRVAPHASRISVVNDQLFTPLLTYVAMFNTLGTTSGSSAPRPSASRAARTLKGHGDLAVRRHLHRRQPDARRLDGRGGPAHDAAGQRLRAGDARRARPHGHHDRGSRARATIERVWLDESGPRAGRTVPLKVLTRSYRGEEKISTVPIEIPANATGELSVLVTDGRQLNSIEQRELRRALQPQSVAQMIRAAQRDAAQQPHLRPAARPARRRRRQRRSADVAAAVGAVGARRRSQRRQLHPDPQRHDRRMGAADGLGDHRLARADDRRRSTAGGQPLAFC